MTGSAEQKRERANVLFIGGNFVLICRATLLRFDKLFCSSLIIDARQIDKFSADLIFVLTVLWFGQLNIGIALY